MSYIVNINTHLATINRCFILSPIHKYAFNTNRTARLSPKVYFGHWIKLMHKVDKIIEPRGEQQGLSPGGELRVKAKSDLRSMPKAKQSIMMRFATKRRLKIGCLQSDCNCGFFPFEKKKDERAEKKNFETEGRTKSPQYARPHSKRLQQVYNYLYNLPLLRMNFLAHNAVKTNNHSFVLPHHFKQPQTRPIRQNQEQNHTTNSNSSSQSHTPPNNSEIIPK